MGEETAIHHAYTFMTVYHVWVVSYVIGSHTRVILKASSLTQDSASSNIEDNIKCTDLKIRRKIEYVM